MTRSRPYHCSACRPKWPAYCAPARCYCNHQQCPAYPSYIPVRETAA